MILLSVRYLDTVVAISPQLERIAWRIGRFKSDFTFPNPSDRFYHEHYVRMLENGNLLLFDNGNGRPAAEGGLYTRALELALDWNSMTATKVWEYRHQVGASGGAPVYKYSDRVGAAQRLENGNTIVWFGADINPTTLAPKSPQTYTLVEADASPEAGAVAVLDVQIPPGTGFPYRALPVETLFGEVPAGTGNGASLTASPNPIPGHRRGVWNYHDQLECAKRGQRRDSRWQPEWPALRLRRESRIAANRPLGDGRHDLLFAGCHWRKTADREQYAGHAGCSFAEVMKTMRMTLAALVGWPLAQPLPYCAGSSALMASMESFCIAAFMSAADGIQLDAL